MLVNGPSISKAWSFANLICGTAKARAGLEEGLKDRPCAVVPVLNVMANRQRVRVLPITHTIPADPSHGLEIPQAAKVRLGLDAERSWVVLTEASDFFWPGPDVRPVSIGDRSNAVYGMPPPGFMTVLRDRLVEQWRTSRAKAVNRTG